jgi:hypothetical protein
VNQKALLAISRRERTVKLTAGQGYCGTFVLLEIADTISGCLPAIRAIDVCTGTQPPKIIKELPAFLILAAKHPKTVLEFGHLHFFHFAPLIGTLPFLAGTKFKGP